MSNKEILELKFYCEDLGRKVSISEYFKELLVTLWEKEEVFSGKHPFGNSGWKYDIYTCLVKNGAVAGTLDEEGYLYSINDKAADEIIFSCMKDMS